MTTKRALVVGISRYDVNAFPRHHLQSLDAAAEEAETLANLLHHGDSDPSDRRPPSGWEVSTLTDAAPGTTVTRHDLEDAVQEHFDLESQRDDANDSPSTDLLFYFSGHAIQSPGGRTTLACYDGPALPFETLMGILGEASMSAHSITVILDCCLSGGIANVPSPLASLIDVLPQNTTILTASMSAQDALQLRQRDEVTSLFTGQLIGGLRGAAADLLGNVTALSLYAHASTGMASVLHRLQSRFSVPSQTPMFKCNTDHPVLLRRAHPQISYQQLSRLVTIFKRPDSRVELTWAHEGLTQERYLQLSSTWKDPDSEIHETEPGPYEGANYRGDINRQPFTGSQKQIENDHLKAFRDAHLLETYQGRDFYWLMDSQEPEHKQVWLNELGKYYWHLVADGRFEEEFAE